MKNKKIIVVFGVILLMVVLGVSYAWLSTTIFGKKEYVLKAGDLDLVLDETSNGLMIEDDLPVEDKVGLASIGATFSVRNNGSSNICYQIYLDDSELLDQEIRVEDKFVKYSVEKDGVVGEANVLSSRRLIDNMEIRAGKSVNYKLRLWFNIEEDGDIVGQVFKGKLRIEAVQCKSSLPVMKSYVDGIKGDFHELEYRQKITSIVTKSDVAIPTEAIESWDVSEAEDGSVIAYAEADETGGYKITIGGKGGISANPNSIHLFANFPLVKNLELEYLDTSNMVSMQAMFAHDTSLTSLDLSNFNTSKVVNMQVVFYNCNLLTELDLTSFDTSKVTDMSSMFNLCTNLKKLNIESFDTTNVFSMKSLFAACHSLETLNLCNFSTINVVTMHRMFFDCTVLKNVDISSFDTSKVIDMAGMFAWSINLQSLNLQNFNTLNVTNFQGIFYKCEKLTNITVSNQWVISTAASSNNMFLNCGVDHVSVI